MIFKTNATLICVQCGLEKAFDAEADVSSIQLRDAKEIRTWEDNAFELEPIKIKGLCTNCKYGKAA